MAIPPELQSEVDEIVKSRLAEVKARTDGQIKALTEELRASQGKVADYDRLANELSNAQKEIGETKARAERDLTFTKLGVADERTQRRLQVLYDADDEAKDDKGVKMSFTAWCEAQAQDAAMAPFFGSREASASAGAGGAAGAAGAAAAGAGAGPATGAGAQAIKPGQRVTRAQVDAEHQRMLAAAQRLPHGSEARAAAVAAARTYHETNRSVVD